MTDSESFLDGFESPPRFQKKAKKATMSSQGGAGGDGPTPAKAPCAGLAETQGVLFELSDAVTPTVASSIDGLSGAHADGETDRADAASVKGGDCASQSAATVDAHQASDAPRDGGAETKGPTEGDDPASGDDGGAREGPPDVVGKGAVVQLQDSDPRSPAKGAATSDPPRSPSGSGESAPAEVVRKDQPAGKRATVRTRDRRQALRASGVTELSFEAPREFGEDLAKALPSRGRQAFLSDLTRHAFGMLRAGGGTDDPKKLARRSRVRPGDVDLLLAAGIIVGKDGSGIGPGGGRIQTQGDDVYLNTGGTGQRRVSGLEVLMVGCGMSLANSLALIGREWSPLAAAMLIGEWMTRPEWVHAQPQPVGRDAITTGVHPADSIRYVGAGGVLVCLKRRADGEIVGQTLLGPVGQPIVDSGTDDSAIWYGPGATVPTVTLTDDPETWRRADGHPGNHVLVVTRVPLQFLRAIGAQSIVVCGTAPDREQRWSEAIQCFFGPSTGLTIESFVALPEPEPGATSTVVQSWSSPPPEIP